jgi:hypothetical protein
VRDIAVFSGNAHPELADEICAHLEVPLHPCRIQRFANDCLEVALEANCRERDVFLIQPLVPPVQENLVELLFMINAARGASAARITVVMPHYAYARSDKKDAPRISIGGRLVADLLVAAGAHRVLTMTLHSPQVHAFFTVPVDHLHALRELAGHFRRYDLSDAMVVSPDLGNAKEAARFARMLDLPVAAAAKQRLADDEVRITSIIGDVTGQHRAGTAGPAGRAEGDLGAAGLHARAVRGGRAPAAVRAARGPGGRLYQHGAHRAGQAGGQAARAVGGSGAGRGGTPDPQRGVGLGGVRVDLTGGHVAARAAPAVRAPLPGRSGLCAGGPDGPTCAPVVHRRVRCARRSGTL